MGARYGGRRRQEIKLWGKKIDFIYSAFSPTLWSSGKILDVGSGNGQRGLFGFFNRGVVASNCTAVDALKDRMLLLKKAGCTCIEIDLEKEKIIDKVPGQFDIIICSHLLEHVSQACEARLLDAFGEMGSNVAICYPEKPKITKKSKKQKYNHKRMPGVGRIVSLLEPHFEDISTELMNSQIFIIAKGNKHE